jgi:hypothetical protein
MAGTVKGYAPAEIIQGPGEVWVIGTAPADAAVRLTLASDGTPDATAHPGSVHLGAIASAITTTAKGKIAPIKLDQYDAPLDSYLTELEGKIEAELAQTASQKAQRMLGVATYSTGAGYRQVTFGGTGTVPKACIAVISPTRAAANRYVVAILYVAVGTGGFTLGMGKGKAATVKTTFVGMADTTRTAGKQVGVLYQTLADAAGGTPTARANDVTEIYQGPADLWVIDTYGADALATAPTDIVQRVTLDAATLTPDSAAHPNAVHLGMTTGAVDFSVVPKIGFISADQFDAPVDCFVESIEAKIEAEMNQSAMDKLARALGVGNYLLSAGAYAQTTWGGTFQPDALCVAAIGRKRLDPTKAVVGCLYRVNAADGITWVASRTKTSTYKLSLAGQTDISRTAGRQMGIFHEMI